MALQNHPVSSTAAGAAAARAVAALPALPPWLLAPAAPACGGLVLFGAVLLGLPVTGTHLAQFQALNRELGKLCSSPPPQAHNVCRLHARLVNGL
jgi:hypothetical protein